MTIFGQGNDEQVQNLWSKYGDKSVEKGRLEDELAGLSDPSRRAKKKAEIDDLDRELSLLQNRIYRPF